jgi:hypothetical protein
MRTLKLFSNIYVLNFYSEIHRTKIKEILLSHKNKMNVTIENKKTEVQ